METFFSHLESRAHAVGSLLCVGLDPHPHLLSDPSAAGALDFCERIIEATSDLACAFKPNSAFFEAWGAEGWAALKEVIRAVPDGIPVILDAKRGDIASSANAYAVAVFEHLGADALTASPYLGRDGLAPFLADPSHGVFLLCKTSNPGADEIQGLTVGAEPLYVRLARRALTWSDQGNLGLVVGATDARALAAVRKAAPDAWILAPGVGAQGGDLAAALRAGLRADGLGMLVAVSRLIAEAGNMRAQAGRLCEEINRLRDEMKARLARAKSRPGAAADMALADALLEAGCVRFGEFRLKSGSISPIYFDLRLLASHPLLLGRAASAYLSLLRGLTFDHLAALPYAGLPIATAISLQGGYPMIYPRKEAKKYGTRRGVEGKFASGDVAVLIDDLATGGESKLEAIERLRAEGIVVRDVVVLIDRQSGAVQALEEIGCRLHALYTLESLLDHWEETGRVGQDQASAVRDFLESERK